MPLALMAATLLSSLNPSPVLAPAPVDRPPRLAADTRWEILNKAQREAKEEIRELRFVEGCKRLATTLALPIARLQDDFKVKDLRQDLERCRQLERSYPLAQGGDLQAVRTFAGVARFYGRNVKQEALKLLLANDASVAARARQLFPVQATFAMKGSSAFDGDKLALNFQQGLPKDAVAWGVPAGETPSAMRAEVEIVEMPVQSGLLKGNALKPYAIEFKGTWTEAGGDPLPLNGSLLMLALNQDHLLRSSGLHERFMDDWVLYELNLAANDPKPLLRSTQKEVPSLGGFGLR